MPASILFHIHFKRLGFLGFFKKLVVEMSYILVFSYIVLKNRATLGFTDAAHSIVIINSNQQKISNGT